MRSIDEEVELTLSSLDSIEKVDLPEGFNKEILQKISFLSKSDPWLKYIKVAIAAMVILSFSNLLALYTLNDTEIANENFMSSNDLEYYFDYDESN